MQRLVHSSRSRSRPTRSLDLFCGRCRLHVWRPVLSMSTTARSNTPSIVKMSENQETSGDYYHFSDRLQLHHAPSHSRPYPGQECLSGTLVLFFSWLGAKEEHTSKYRKLYLDRGMDVFSIKASVWDFLWPPTSFKLARQTSEILQDRCKEYDHYFFHSTSIGSYNMTVFRMLISDQNDKAHLLNKVQGIIYDSLVVGEGKAGIHKQDYGSMERPGDKEHDEKEVNAITRMIKGVSTSVTKNVLLRVTIQCLAQFYFFLTQAKTVKFYDRALAVVRDDPILVPTLILTSKNDPMCDAAVVEQLVKLWSDMNVPVIFKMWDNSKHAQHLKYHTDEYLALVDSLLHLVCGQQMEPSFKSKL